MHQYKKIILMIEMINLKKIQINLIKKVLNKIHFKFNRMYQTLLTIIAIIIYKKISI